MAMNTKIAASGKSLTSVLISLARGVSEDQYLRELIRNGLDALERGSDTNGNFEKYVRIARDKTHNNKMVIANSKAGDPLTIQIVKDHLLSLGNSGHDLDENFGIGAKLSYICKYEGYKLLYRCREEGVSFVVHINPSTETLELMSQQIIYADEERPTTVEFVPCEDSEFTFEDSETEVVLLGRFSAYSNSDEEEDDTWVEACDMLGKSTRGHGAGWLIRDYVNHKWWELPEDMKIEIFIYNKDKSFREKAIICPLKDFKERKEVSGTVVHPDGTEIEFYAIPYKLGTSKSSHEMAGHITYIHKGELIYYTKGMTEYARKNVLQSAGIWALHNYVFFAIKPSQDLWEQTSDRSAIVDEKGVKFTTKIPDYLRWISDNMPKNLQEWMDSHRDGTDTTDSYEKIAKSLMTKAKNEYKSSKQVTTKPGSMSGQAHSSGVHGQNNTPAVNKNFSKPPKVVNRSRASSAGSKRTNNSVEPPGLKIIRGEEEECCIDWNITQNDIIVNTGNPVFAFNAEKVNKGKNYPIGKLNHHLAGKFYLNVISWYNDLIYSHQNMSPDMLEESLKDGRLDAVMINYQTRTVQKRIENDLRAEGGSNGS